MTGRVSDWLYVGSKYGQGEVKQNVGRTSRIVERVFNVRMRGPPEWTR